MTSRALRTMDLLDVEECRARSRLGKFRWKPEYVRRPGTSMSATGLGAQNISIHLCCAPYPRQKRHDRLRSARFSDAYRPTQQQRFQSCRA